MATEYFMFPASFAQQRLWFLEQMAPGTASYNMSRATRFPYAINVAVLKKSLNEIVRRHETLRTTFKTVNGQPYQLVASSLELDIFVHDVSQLDAVRREAAASELAHADALRSFDIANGPLIRASLVKLGSSDYIFLLSMHHIISDVWSVMIFFNELGALYESFLQNKPSPLPELPLQYADYAVWQLDYLKERALQQQVDFWKRKLADLPPVQLPFEKKRPVFQSFRGAHEWIGINKDLTNELRRISQQENVTLFMTLLSAFVALLYRYSNQQDIVVGVPVAGRNQLEVENLIGFFVNSIIIRTKFAPDFSFRQLLREVKSVSLEAFAHSDLPFEKLVEELHPQRDLSRNPLFQVLFQMAAGREGYTVSPGKDGLDVKVNISKFDLTLSMAEEEGRLTGFFEYNTDLFLQCTIAQMIDHYIHLLKHVVRNPAVQLAEIELLDRREKEIMLKQWNKSERVYPGNSFVHGIIEQNAVRFPDKVALYSEHEKITYGEMMQLVNKMANYLVSLGAAPETTVAVCMDRSVSMVIIHLAILTAGAAFVPFDPAYPDDRLAFMLHDTRPGILILEAQHAGKFDKPAIPVIIVGKEKKYEAFSAIAPKVALDPRNRAYIMFTSGSTGKPKGVEICHEGLMNMVCWNVETYGITSTDQCLQMATPAYDAYVYELFPCLVAGATAYLVDDFSRTSALQLKHIIFEKQLTVCFLPTALAESVVRESWPAVVPLRILGTAGEKLKIVPTHLLPFRFLNLYGPTENTVIASWFEVRPGNYDQPPIGRPIANTRLYILDAHLNPVPVGVTGELFISGKSVARGYYRRASLTAEKFIPDPFSEEPGSRLYRTGDIVRYLTDGNIDFIGREDHQVKLRGLRIELKEIEHQLLEHPDVTEAAVLISELSPQNNALVAYLALKDGKETGAATLRTFLKERLPAFMLPSLFIFLDELPKSFSGKINEKALPPPEKERQKQEESYGHISHMERTISQIWKQYLPVEKVGIDANFFDMGGHSLMMAQVHFRLREALAADISLMDLFQYPTIRSLSKYIESLPAGKELVAGQL